MADHSTSTLKYHLEKKHPFTGSKNESSSSTSSRRKDDEQRNHQRTGQQSILSFTANKRVSKELEQSIAKKLCTWICGNIRPIAIVEDEGLSELLKTATQDDQYKPPGRTSITQKIKDLYESNRLDIQVKLDAVENVVLAIDYWTSVSTHSYLGVIAFFLSNWKLSSVVLGIDHSVVTHTSEHIQAQVEAFMNKWKVGLKVKHIVSDNANNMTKAIKLLNRTHFPCMAHTLQLCINHGIEQAGISVTLAKCRKVVCHFKHSAPKMAELKAIQVEDEQRTKKPSGLVSLKSKYLLT